MKTLFFILIFSSVNLLNTVLAKDLIINFSKVNDGIYRGARLTSVDAVKYLKSIGVKNVINLQGGDLESDLSIIIPWAEPGEKPEVIAWEKATSLANNIGFLHAPLNSLEPVTKLEDQSIDAVLNFMHTRSNQPVFIHCEHGADRTGLLVALYRVKYEGVSAAVAHEEWIQNGHNKLHQLFTGDLDKYFYLKIKQFEN